MGSAEYDLHVLVMSICLCFDLLAVCVQPHVKCNKIQCITKFSHLLDYKIFLVTFQPQ